VIKFSISNRGGYRNLSIAIYSIEKRQFQMKMFSDLGEEKGPFLSRAHIRLHNREGEGERYQREEKKERKTEEKIGGGEGDKQTYTHT